MRFFSAESSCGSRTSHGFSNDTIVRVFDSKRSRDQYVFLSDNISCKAIPASKATMYATNYDLGRNETNAPKPFTRECWAISNWSHPYDRVICGYIGNIECVNSGEIDGKYIIERLYK